jgi:ribosomal protein S18 acetylase RimI-like enzyme
VEPTVTFAAADALTLGELTPLVNRAYEAYFVPLSYDVAHIAWHLTRSDIERSKSVVGYVDGQPFGVSLAGVRGKRAWIGGFGIAVEHRRKGLAIRLMAEQIARLRAAGIAEVGLEVIEQNPARELYRRCGFAETRELLVFGGAAKGEAAELQDVSTAELCRAHSRLHAEPPAWRRQVPTLVNDVEAGADPLALRRDGKIVAFAVVEPKQDRLWVHDAAAADVQAAGLLLGGLAARWPGLDLRLIDEPPGTPLAQAALAAGMTVGLKQVEMTARL